MLFHISQFDCFPIASLLQSGQTRFTRHLVQCKALKTCQGHYILVRDTSALLETLGPCQRDHKRIWDLFCRGGKLGEQCGSFLHCSTNLKKKKSKICEIWHLTHDTWHMTCDMWHLTHRGWWTLSQNFRSLAITVWELWCIKDWEEKGDWAT